MARPVSGTKALTAANAVNICASQTPAGAGSLTLVSSPVILDSQRRVLLTCAGNNTGVNFTVTGTRDGGQPISEVIAGSNVGTTVSINDFRTVTAVTIGAASVGAVTLGTNTTGSTPWFNLDTYVPAFNLDVDLVLTGAATFSIETTASDYLTAGTAVNVQPTTVVGSAASVRLSTTAPQRAWRLTITAGTGAVAFDATQSGY